jgi:hypothetical protein
LGLKKGRLTTRYLVRPTNRHGFAIRTIPMKNTHLAVMSELLVGRRLDWLR